jgi:hypothetical protein
MGMRSMKNLVVTAPISGTIYRKLYYVRPHVGVDRSGGPRHVARHSVDEFPGTLESCPSLDPP